jgi:hypothetical protein
MQQLRNIVSHVFLWMAIAELVELKLLIRLARQMGLGGGWGADYLQQGTPQRASSYQHHALQKIDVLLCGVDGRPCCKKLAKERGAESRVSAEAEVVRWERAER